MNRIFFLFPPLFPLISEGAKGGAADFFKVAFGKERIMFLLLFRTPLLTH